MDRILCVHIIIIIIILITIYLYICKQPNFMSLLLGPQRWRTSRKILNCIHLFWFVFACILFFFFCFNVCILLQCVHINVSYVCFADVHCSSIFVYNHFTILCHICYIYLYIFSYHLLLLYVNNMRL